jgi:hypothetical protein
LIAMKKIGGKIDGPDPVLIKMKEAPLVRMRTECPDFSNDDSFSLLFPNSYCILLLERYLHSLGAPQFEELGGKWNEAGFLSE